MADFEVRISDLPGANPLTGIELVPMVQGGVTKTRSVRDLVFDGGFQEHLDNPDPHQQYAFRIINNLTATTDPLPSNDATEGYQPLSRWVNTLTAEVWLCVDASVGAANWQVSTLTIDDLGSAALENVGTLPSELPTNQTVTDKFLEKSDNLSTVANATTSFDNIKQNATTSYKGVVEVATNAEALAGTATKFPDAASVHAAFNQYGLGEQQISAQVNANLYTTAGTYVAPTSGHTNFPAGSNSRCIITVGGGSNYIKQEVQQTVSPFRRFLRSGSTADLATATWSEIYHADSSGAGTGLDADLLDGQQGTFYLDFPNFTSVPNPKLTLAGDATGSATFTGLGNATLTVVVKDDSHNHIISNIDGLPALVTKLDGIESGATADQTASEIKVAYESNANTNAYTDTEKSKLNGIEAGATADQTASEIKTAYESNANTNAYTDSEKSKLGGVAAGAQVNTVTSVDGRTGAVTSNNYYVSALGFASGTGLLTATVTGATNRSVSLDGRYLLLGGKAADSDKLDGLNSTQLLRSDTGTIPTARLPAAALIGDTTYSAGTGISLSGTVFSLTDQRFTSALLSKLNGIETGATGDQTKAEIDALGINATQLGGLSSGNFLRSNASDVFSGSELTFTNTTRWDVSGSNSASQRADSRVEGSTSARLHWYGLNSSGGTENFKQAWFDGTSYVDVTVAASTVTFGGNVTITGTFNGSGSGLTGTASLRATGTTKADVGLSVVDNYNRAHYDARYVNKTDFISGNSSSGISNPDSILTNAVTYAQGTTAAGFNDGAIYAQMYNNAQWGHQIFGNYRDGNMAVRGRNGSTFTPWLKVYTEGNKPSKADVGLSNVPNWSQATFDGRYLAIGANAVSATKLASINTSFSGTYPVAFNVNGVVYSHSNIAYNGSAGILSLPVLTANAVNTKETNYQNAARNEGVKVEYNETSKSLEYNFF